MSSRKIKIIFWVSTTLLSLLMLLSASMYFFNHKEVVSIFESLGYPSYIIYPLASLKILAILSIITRKSKTLVEWAYAGLFFNFVLALTAHINVNDGGHFSALVALILLFTSYFAGKYLT